MKPIVPCLWFDDRIEAAVKFYVSIFNHSKILYVTRYGEKVAKMAGMKKGKILTIAFRINGQEYLALNGRPNFKFTEAVSFIVTCKNQKELDLYWKKLTSGGGKAVACGWLKDKFGMSWQIVPESFDRVMKSGDAEKIDRWVGALDGMKKLDVAKLEKAARGK